MNNPTLAVIDADFLNKIDEVQRASPDELFRKLMQALNYSPVVHPYVMEHELFSCSLARRMVDSGELRVVAYDEFLPGLLSLQQSNPQRDGYVKLFQDLYHVLTLEDCGVQQDPDSNVFARHSGKSYGEVHSVLMANEMHIPIICSNDHSTKTICKRFPKGRITALTISDIHARLAAQEASGISASEWKYLLHK